MKRTDTPTPLGTDELQGNGDDLAKLLEFILKHRTCDLLNAGLSEADLFELRKIAHAYSTNTLEHVAYQKLQGLMPKLETLHIVW